MPVHLPFTPAWLLWPTPWVFALALLPAAWAWVLWREWRGPRAAMRYSRTPLVRAACGRDVSRGVLPVVHLAALTALLIAVARPQAARQTIVEPVECVAIEMVVDTSSSMLDEDLSPPGEHWSRLDIVKDVFRRFVTGDEALPGRPDDLIGMIRFAAHADSACPLTLDHDALLTALDETDVPLDALGGLTPESSQTAIGDGVALAVSRLEEVGRRVEGGTRHSIRSRVIILLTDGENNAGMVTPRAAGALAAACDVRVYTILAGTGRVAGWGREAVDDAVLRQIAAGTGGRHYRVFDRDALDHVYAEIDELERTRTERQRYVHWLELGRPLLIVAAMLLGGHVGLAATLLRRIP